MPPLSFLEYGEAVNEPDRRKRFNLFMTGYCTNGRHSESNEGLHTEFDGLDTAAKIKKHHPDTRIIIENLSVSPNTVKCHIKNLLTKTGYRSTLQLIVDVVSKPLILPKF